MANQPAELFPQSKVHLSTYTLKNGDKKAAIRVDIPLLDSLVRQRDPDVVQRFLDSLLAQGGKL